MNYFIFLFIIILYLPKGESVLNTETLNTFAFDPCEYPFNIEVSGITECTEAYTTERSNSYCYILEYILSGSETLLCNGKKYNISKGDVYLLPKGSNHKYAPLQNDPCNKLWFNIDGILVPSLTVAYGIQDTVVFKNFSDETLFRELFNLTSKNIPKKETMEEGAIIFHKIVAALYNFKNAGRIKSDVNAIKDILDSNIYSESFSLKQISNALCLSQSHIINIFKKAYNQTPYQYLLTQRIKIACNMLLNSQMSINEISEALHFADQHYFTNAFKKVMYITPSEFRKSNSIDYLVRANRNIKQGVSEPDETRVF